MRANAVGRSACRTLTLNSLVEPFFFYPMGDKIAVINQGGPEVRHIYLNVPHSNDVKPSWYGESVGHYEDGNTLVIDTIGISPKSYVDNYRTPHTDQLHVIERWTLAPDAKTVDVSVYVEDPGAFTKPWTAVQRWRRVDTEPILMTTCNENNSDFFSAVPGAVARSDTPGFLIFSRHARPRMRAPCALTARVG